MKLNCNTVLFLLAAAGSHRPVFLGAAVIALATLAACQFIRTGPPGESEMSAS